MIWVGPHAITSILRRGREREVLHREGYEPCGHGGKDGGMGPRARNRQQPLDTGRGEEMDLPWSRQRKHGPADTLTLA